MSLGDRRVVIFVTLILFLTGCATSPSPYEKGTPIAVWDVENLSTSGGRSSGLGELLSSQVIEALQKRGDFTVVEREHLILALEELGLGTTSVVDEATQLELGRLVGARLMVFGGYQVIEDKMSLDLRLVEVETGRVLKATRKITSASDLAGWLRAAEEATAGLF
jgi:curli biogenesis system outer membrane secretion channel CsgG